MIPEDLAQMARRLEQEALLHAAGFEPIRPNARELFTRDLELYTRSRALEVLAGEGEGEAWL